MSVNARDSAVNEKISLTMGTSLIPTPIMHVAHVLADTPLYNAHVQRMARSCARHTPGPIAYHLIGESSLHGSTFVASMTRTFAQLGVVQWYFVAPPHAARRPSHHSSVLLKLMLPDILPAAVTTVLYLDVDVACVGSLRSVLAFYDAARGAAPRTAARPMGMVHAFGGPDPEFNSGVIAFYLPELRRMNWTAVVRHVLGHSSILDTFKAPCHSNTVIRRWQSCSGWADQDIFCGLNRRNGGQLIARLPCTTNVQLVQSQELTRCLSDTTPPIVLHTHRSIWKQRLINGSAEAAHEYQYYRGSTSASSLAAAARRGRGKRAGRGTRSQSHAHSGPLVSPSELQAARLFWAAAEGKDLR